MSEGLSRGSWNKWRGPAQRGGCRLCRESPFTDRSDQCSVARGGVGFYNPTPGHAASAGFGAAPQGVDARTVR